jgi:transcriptional regulator with GAF, ATPase, and Fis domain
LVLAAFMRRFSGHVPAGVSRRLERLVRRAPGGSGRWSLAVTTALLAPEPMMALIWTGAAVVALMRWSLWLPMALPMGALCGSLVAHGWTLPGRVRALSRQTRRLQDERLALLKKLRQLEQLQEERLAHLLESETEAPPPAATLATARDEMLELSAQLDELHERLEKHLPRYHPPPSAPSDGETPSELAVRLRETRDEITSLLTRLELTEAQLEGLAARAGSLSTWADLRLTAYRNLFERVSAILETVLEESGPLRQAITGPILYGVGEPDRLDPIVAETGFITQDEALLKQLRQIKDRFAPSDQAVLIRGESGCGKELIAKMLHRYSKRRGKPFVAISCRDIPETLLETELFGYVKGAFSGAHRDGAGLFAQADGGTLFIDELGEMPLSMQTKLLRVLQEHAVSPVGGDKRSPRKTDFRLLAATNADLAGAVRAGQFREDLYQRFHVLEVVLKPLRERGDDIRLLARWFLTRECAATHTHLGLSEAAVAALEAHPWPGNVRELEHVIEALVTRYAVASDLPAPILTGDQVRSELLPRRAILRLEERDLFSDEDRELLELARRHAFNAKEMAGARGARGGR